MSLTADQKKRPHRITTRYGGQNTMLEGAFRRARGEDIAWWDQSGVVEATLNTPKRAPGLIHAICRGLWAGLDPSWLKRIPFERMPDSHKGVWWHQQLLDRAIPLDMDHMDWAIAHNVPPIALRLGFDVSWETTDATVSSMALPHQEFQSPWAVLLSRLIDLPTPPPAVAQQLALWLHASSPDDAQWTQALNHVFAQACTLDQNHPWQPTLAALRDELLAQPVGPSAPNALSNLLHHLPGAPRAHLCATPVVCTDWLTRLAQTSAAPSINATSLLCVLPGGPGVLLDLWARGQGDPWSAQDRGTYAKGTTVLDTRSFFGDPSTRETMVLTFLKTALTHIRAQGGTPPTSNWWAGAQQDIKNSWVMDPKDPDPETDTPHAQTQRRAELLVLCSDLHALVPAPTPTPGPMSLLSAVPGSNALLEAMEHLRPGSPAHVWATDTTTDTTGEVLRNQVRALLGPISEHVSHPTTSTWISRNATDPRWASVIWAVVAQNNRASPTAMTSETSLRTLLDLTQSPPGRPAWSQWCAQLGRSIATCSTIMRTVGLSPELKSDFFTMLTMNLAVSDATHPIPTWPNVMELVDAALAQGASPTPLGTLALCATEMSHVQDLVDRGATHNTLPTTTRIVRQFLERHELQCATNSPSRPSRSRAKM